MRLDIYLTENSLCKSRKAAQSLIISGGVSLNGIPCTKPSQEVGEGDTVDIIGEQLRYVGRGGLKLEAALDKFALDITVPQRAASRTACYSMARRRSGRWTSAEISLKRACAATRG